MFRAIAGILNNISTSPQVFFDNGGLGIVIGDGQLPHPGHRADFGDLLHVSFVRLEGDV